MNAAHVQASRKKKEETWSENDKQVDEKNARQGYHSSIFSQLVFLQFSPFSVARHPLARL